LPVAGNEIHYSVKDLAETGARLKDYSQLSSE
jgi:hypothetical protein